MLKNRFLLVVLILIGLSIGVFSISENWFIDFIIKQISLESGPEKKHLANLLNSAFVIKLKSLLVVLLLLIGVIFRYFKNVTSSFRAEYSLFASSISHSTTGKFYFYLKIVIVLIAIIGVFLIGNIPVNTDETYCYEYFTSRNPLISLTSYPAPNNHILFSYISSVIHLLVPWKLYALRLPSLLFSLTNIFILAFYLKRNHNNYVIAASLILILGSFYPLFYALQGRGYALYLLLTTVFTILIIDIWNKKEFRFPITFIVISILGFYTIPTFLYPFLFFFVTLLFIIPFSKLLKIGIYIGLGILLLYLPIIVLFDIDNLINNDFIKPIGISDILVKYPDFISSLIKNFFPIFMLFIISIAGIKHKNITSNLFVGLVLFTILLPLIYHKFPPNRTLLYLFPISTIVACDIIDKRKWLIYIVPLLLIINVNNIRENFTAFYKFSNSAKEISNNAKSNNYNSIYVLDGPRSFYKWHNLGDFQFSLYRDPLNNMLLNDSKYVFISMYRHEEINMNQYEILSKNDYFRLFRLIPQINAK